MKKLLLLCVFSQIIFANNFPKKNLKEYREQHKILVKTFLRKQNFFKDILNRSYKTTGPSKTLILKLDRKWQSDDKFRYNILNNGYSSKLKAFVKNKKAQIAEAFLTDNVGGLIAAYPQTSDFYQGDEDKFKKAVALKKTFISQPVWDESTRSVSFFISTPVYGDNKKLLGVLIVGVDVSREFIMDLDMEQLLLLEVRK